MFPEYGQILKKSRVCVYTQRAYRVVVSYERCMQTRLALMRDRCWKEIFRKSHALFLNAIPRATLYTSQRCWTKQSLANSEVATRTFSGHGWWARDLRGTNETNRTYKPLKLSWAELYSTQLGSTQLGSTQAQRPNFELSLSHVWVLFVPLIRPQVSGSSDMSFEHQLASTLTRASFWDSSVRITLSYLISSWH